MNKVKVGDKVRFIGEGLHKHSPQYYPKLGTIGTVKACAGPGKLVQWPIGSTSDDDMWRCNDEWLEPVEITPDMGQQANESRREIYLQAIRKWGSDMQTQVAIEEMSELTKEICKAYRGQENVRAIADEIADVTIMLEQLRVIYDVEEETEKRIEFKVDRLKKRIGGAEE